MAALKHQLGDKVRLKENAAIPGLRGIITVVEPRRVVIRSEIDGCLVQTEPHYLTNFSLAARKAWKKMPDRRVGRPKGSRVCDRISVTIRFDRELWQRFRVAENEGLIADRTATLNRWLTEHLERVSARAEKIAS